MILRKIAALVVPVSTALVVAAGTTYAQPAAPAPMPDIGYEVKRVGDHIVSTLTNGVFEVTGDSVQIKNAEGRAMVTLPLVFRHEGSEYPIDHIVRDEGRVLELTPVKDESRARPAPVTPVASPMENQMAMDAFLAQFGIASAIGGFVGLVIGGLVGGLGLLGGPVGLASIPLGATVGSIIGTIIAGGPTLIIAGIELINALNAPPGTTRFAEQARN
ncbi:hypothetical protein [Nocardia donostiensis]|uniref:DUF8020 domain-containing protein n=1 Tax=Nocardia donostiensis TaxID=1538463 RepID=A0A1W0B4E5_9NOCA|nr:hypothetical protein [Nocardia donostiensis]ONM50421.1 hypothetical protein B0T46_00355 [Nocardia donostiensis]OQS17344.1 hypothetical protein B0T36_01805 [Nocardia donostiensis]OQS18728.1 hypothetical protein B0T44_18040 [Nocardia donostiensis]